MKFLCDAMLAKLARWLRIFGYDAELASENDKDDDIIARAKLEKRTLLSRDKKIIQKAKLGYYLPFNDSAEQVKYLIKELGIKISEEPQPLYCSLCNGELVEEKKENLPAHVSEGWVCIDCKQQYWEGAHWKGIKRFIKRVKACQMK